MNKIKKYHFEMSDKEVDLFENTTKNSGLYLEFGMGGSSYNILLNTKAKLICVESDEKWVNKVLNSDILKDVDKTRVKKSLVNIGPTGAWGAPIGDKHKDKFPDYSSKIFKDLEKVDTILIDGRFRVACTLQSIINQPQATIIIHDYFNRPQYHILNEFLDIVDKADTLGVFKVKDDVNLVRVNELYEKYKIIPS